MKYANKTLSFFCIVFKAFYFYLFYNEILAICNGVMFLKHPIFLWKKNVNLSNCYSVKMLLIYEIGTLTRFSLAVVRLRVTMLRTLFQLSPSRANNVLSKTSSLNRTSWNTRKQCQQKHCNEMIKELLWKCVFKN